LLSDFFFSERFFFQSNCFSFFNFCYTLFVFSVFPVAVDAHVGEHLFNRCIKEALKDKTVLLVTHQLHVLPQCDKIVILDDNGGILIAGTYDEIMQSGVDVDKYLARAEEEDEEDGGGGAAAATAGGELVTVSVGDGSEALVTATTVAEAGEGEVAAAGKLRSNSIPVSGSSGGGGAQERHHTRSGRAHSGSKRDHDSKKGGGGGADGSALMTKEEKNDGEVPLSTYIAYVKSGGLYFFWIVILGQIFCQVLQVEANFWLVDWGKNTQEYEYGRNVAMPKSRSFYWFRGYAGMLMASIVCLTVSRLVLTYHRTAAAATMHQNLLARVLQYPVAFFDITPIGRIINRFSQDMATVDEDLANTMSQVISMTASVLGSIGAIAGSTRGTFLILMVPLAYLYKVFNSYFRKANTAIARLESVSRSPIYADFSQALSGTTTIRAYNQNQRFIERLEGYANANTVPGVLQQVASQWLSIRLDFLGAIVMLFMGVLTLTSKDSNFIPAGYLALGLSYSIQVTHLLIFMFILVAVVAVAFAVF
jgi:ABC-type multidrug transport system fused ATPase/permease subunit